MYYNKFNKLKQNSSVMKNIFNEKDLKERIKDINEEEKRNLDFMIIFVFS